MKLVLRERFPYKEWQKKKKQKKFPRLAQYNLGRNIILDHPYAQRLYGMKPKPGDFFLFRGAEKIVRYEGELELEAIAAWAIEKSTKKIKFDSHDEL